MNLFHFVLKFALCWLCAYKTRTTMRSLNPQAFMQNADPSGKDASVLNYLTFENEMFKSHWAWLNTLFFPDDSTATGFPVLAVF